MSFESDKARFDRRRRIGPNKLCKRPRPARGIDKKICRDIDLPFISFHLDRRVVFRHTGKIRTFINSYPDISRAPKQRIVHRRAAYTQCRPATDPFRRYRRITSAGLVESRLNYMGTADGIYLFHNAKIGKMPQAPGRYEFTAEFLPRKAFALNKRNAKALRRKPYRKRRTRRARTYDGDCFYLTFSHSFHCTRSPAMSDFFRGSAELI
jgi:hypothetical protein